MNDKNPPISDLAQAQNRIDELEEAVVWMSAAHEFQEGGACRVGFERLVLPLLESINGAEHDAA